MTPEHVQSQPSEKPTLIFQASKGRKIALILILLLLIPLPALLILMMYRQLQTGISYDIIIVLILTIFLIGALVFLLLQIFVSIFTYIELKALDAKFILPKWFGPVPLPPYEKLELTYDNVQKIETRNEVYQTLFFSNLMRVSSFVTRDGNRYILGYSKENAIDPALPFADISYELAARSALPIANRGTIKGRKPYHLLDMTSAHLAATGWEQTPLPPAKVISLKRRTRLFWLALTGVVALMASIIVLLQN